MVAPVGVDPLKSVSIFSSFLDKGRDLKKNNATPQLDLICFHGRRQDSHYIINE